MVRHAAEIPELLQRLGLISPAEIVADGVIVSDCSRRNRNFRAEIGRTRGFLLKFAHDESTKQSLAAEAAAYGAIHELAVYTGARKWVPRLHHWDATEARLIVELVPRAVSLDGVRRPPMAAFSAMGTALAALHEAGSRAGRRPGRSWPWILNFHRPTVEMFSEVSSANLSLIGIVQGLPRLTSSLERLLVEWSADSIIHADIKWDNWIVELGEDNDLLRLALVDWELACYGDAAWDIGATFSEFLSQWIESVPVTVGNPPANFSSLARRSLVSMRPAIRSFWNAYVGRRRWPRNTATWTLIRAVQMSAARLLQRTWERHQRANDLTGHGVASIQVASHLLREPHLAAVRLLGLPLS